MDVDILDKAFVTAFVLGVMGVLTFFGVDGGEGVLFLLGVDGGVFAIYYMYGF
jgi:hypothetical protein